MVDMEKLHLHVTELNEFCTQLELSIEQRLQEEQCKSGLELFKPNQFNPRSSKHIVKVLYKMMGLPERTTEKGSLSANNDVLKEFAHEQPFCKLIIDYRKFRKQLEIFLTVFKFVNNYKCYPLYNQYKTTSGRLTATSPPIQIIPKNTVITTKVISDPQIQK